MGGCLPKPEHKVKIELERTFDKRLRPVDSFAPNNEHVRSFHNAPSGRFSNPRYPF
jgi:hypothetical protein